MSGLLNGLFGIGADFTLWLGEVAFSDLEIPSEISGGGSQLLATHKYPGGLRTVDSYGPDDEPISWSGMFLGPLAEQRCYALDTMRRQGLAVPLVYSQANYVVVIRAFTWRFQRYYQIPYSISLEVVQDQTQQPPYDVTPDANDLFSTDLAALATSITSLVTAGIY